MKSMCMLFLLWFPTAYLWAGTSELSCTRKFDDRAIRDIIEKAIVKYSLSVDRPHRIDVNWAECKYYAVIWRTDPPPSPDSEIIFALDADGEIVRRPGMQR